MSGDRRRTRHREERSALHGRDRELALLIDLLDDAIASQGSLAIVSGEAGIGKTSLVNALVDAAGQRGCVTLRGNCYDLTTTPPYGPWLEMLPAARRRLPDLPPLPDALSGDTAYDPILDHRALYDEVASFLRAVAERRPLVIVLEDVQWADPASIDLLRHVARAIVGERVLVTTTHRDDEPEPTESFQRDLPSLIRESRVCRIELRRLDGAAVAALTRDRYALEPIDETRLVTHVQRLAEGNPLFVHELLRALEHEQTLRQRGDAWQLGDLAETRTPPLILRVIERRLSHLDDTTQSALEAAAVIGHFVPLALWLEMSGLDEGAFDQAVEQALAAHVLQEDRGRSGLVFTHALVRAAVYERIILTRRRARHRDIAALLAARPSPDPDLIAHHFQRAGDERALEWLTRAGLRAWDAAAWASAADRFIVAAAMLEDDASRASARGWLLYLAATLLRYMDNERSLDLLDQAATLAWDVGDDMLGANALWHRGVSYCHVGGVRDGLELMFRGIEGLDRAGRESEALPDETQARAGIASLIGGYGSVSLEDRPLTWQRAGLDAPALFQRGPLINWLSMSGRYGDAVTMGERWVADMRVAHANHPYPREMTGVSGRYGLCRAYAMLGRVDDARREYPLTRAAASATGDFAFSTFLALDEFKHVVMQYDATDLRRRTQVVRDTRADTARTEGQLSGITMDVLCKAIIDLVEGRWDDIAEPEWIEQEGVLAFYAREFRLILATVARQRGAPESAWSHVANLLPGGPTYEPGDCIFVHANAAQRLAAELSLGAGDLDAARAWLEAHDRWLDWSGALVGRAEGHTLWARCFELAGDVARARVHAEQALSIASDPRQPFATIVANRVLGRLAVRDGENELASRCLIESLQEAEACSAPHERALTLLEIAALHAATGQMDEALAHAREARDICGSLRAAPALARVAELEARLAPPRARTSHVAGLSPREVEVLRLVALGLGNPEIGERLFISRRTVERHVSAILAKIDAANRTEATRFAIEHDLA